MPYAARACDAALATALATALLLLTPATGRAAAPGTMAETPDGMKAGAPGAAMGNGSHQHQDASAAPAGPAAAQAGPAGATAQGAAKVGVSERLGQQADLDAVLVGEDGQKLRLGDLVTMPTILAPVYYSCPNECNVLLGTLASALPQLGLTPGRDYQVLAVSFDDRDTPATATKRKGDFLNAGAIAGMRDFPPQAWRFLTGDEANIRRLMDSIGFGFKRQGDDFVHTVVLVVLSPSGKITRYLYGVKPLPFDLAMAATEAAGGRTGLSIQRAVALCYTYDPQGRRYVFDIVKVAGASVLAAMGLFGLFLAFGGKKRKISPKDGPPKA